MKNEKTQEKRMRSRRDQRTPEQDWGRLEEDWTRLDETERDEVRLNRKS